MSGQMHCSHMNYKLRSINLIGYALHPLKIKVMFLYVPELCLCVIYAFRDKTDVNI